MYYTILVSILLLVQFANIQGTETTCEDSQKQFANLCFSPAPTIGYDMKWAKENQPAEGWHVESGNDIIRLHFTEVLKGQILTLKDNFDDACIRIRIEHANKGDDGGVYGYGNLTANWNCTLSQDKMGLLSCDWGTSGPSKYHENFNMYFTYSDSKNLSVAIYCFPNGQVGWASLTITQHLSDEEEKVVASHVKSLGFTEGSTTLLHGEKCPRVM